MKFRNEQVNQVFVLEADSRVELVNQIQSLVSKVDTIIDMQYAVDSLSAYCTKYSVLILAR